MPDKLVTLVQFLEARPDARKYAQRSTWRKYLRQGRVPGAEKDPRSSWWLLPLDLDLATIDKPEMGRPPVEATNDNNQEH